MRSRDRPNPIDYLDWKRGRVVGRGQQVTYRVRRVNPDMKRPVSGRFRVTLSADWPDAVVESVRESTGATITSVKGHVIEGHVALEIRRGDTATAAIKAWVEVGLGVLMKAEKPPQVEILETKG